MPEKGSPQWLKKRGQYFNALEKNLAEKYGTTMTVIHKLRKGVIFYKDPYSEIFKHYAEKAYISAHKRIPETDTIATKVSRFMRTATIEQLDDITRLTKYDYDFVEEVVD